ncbi:MAG TPA: hypothetical protein VGJ03_10215 [Acidimicrobiales bacterium]
MTPEARSASADIALAWWRAFGEADLETLCALSSKPVRYMVARGLVADALNALDAEGDVLGSRDVLLACQDFALHGARGPRWSMAGGHQHMAVRPARMDQLISAMRMFPLTVADLDGYTQITFHPPDSPPMPWTVDLTEETVVGFAVVLWGTQDAAQLGERVALDPAALWR